MEHFTDEAYEYKHLFDFPGENYNQMSDQYVRKWGRCAKFNVHLWIFHYLCIDIIISGLKG